MEYYNVIPNTDTTFGEAMEMINQNFDLTHTALGDVEYATRKNKGLFSTPSALQTAVPHPQKGDWALVGDSFPAAIYVCNTDDTWSDSGKTYSGDSVDLTDYVTDTAFEAFKSLNTIELNGISEDIDELTSDKGRVVRVNYWTNSAPTVAGNGELWYDTTNNLLKQATVVGTAVTWNTITTSESDMYVDVTGGGAYYWGGSSMVLAGQAESLVTQVQYDALPSQAKASDTKYIIYEEL